MRTWDLRYIYTFVNDPKSRLILVSSCCTYIEGTLNKVTLIGGTLDKDTLIGGTLTKCSLIGGTLIEEVPHP